MAEKGRNGGRKAGMCEGGRGGRMHGAKEGHRNSGVYRAESVNPRRLAVSPPFRHSFDAPVLPIALPPSSPSLMISFLPSFLPSLLPSTMPSSIPSPSSPSFAPLFIAFLENSQTGMDGMEDFGGWENGGAEGRMEGRGERTKGGKFNF